MLKWFSKQIRWVEVKPGPPYVDHVDHMRWILLRISLQAALATDAGRFVYDLCYRWRCHCIGLCEVKKWRLEVGVGGH